MRSEGAATIRVLVVGRGLPEQGGIPTFLELLMRGLGEDGRVAATYCNLTAPHARAAAGRLTMGNLRRLAADVRRVFRESRGADVVHYHCATTALGKDAADAIRRSGGDPSDHRAITAPLTFLRGGAFAAAGRLRGARVVMHVHSNDDLSWGLTTWGRLSLRFACLAVDSFLAVSRPIEAVLREVFPRRLVSYVANAVDVHEFDRRHERAPAAPVRITYLGVVTGRKGLDVMKDAFERLADLHDAFQVEIAGSAPAEGPAEFERVRAAYAASGLPNVEFTGNKDHDGVVEVLCRTDVLVLASFGEGLPMVILEAMSAGAAVVATAVGQVADAVVDGTTGFIVPVGDDAALADALERLVTDPELLAALSSGARKRAEEHFDLSRLVDDVVDVYESTVA